MATAYPDTDNPTVDPLDPAYDPALVPDPDAPDEDTSATPDPEEPE